MSEKVCEITFTPHGDARGSLIALEAESGY